jgi:hypothetical protein
VRNWDFRLRVTKLSVIAQKLLGDILVYIYIVCQALYDCCSLLQDPEWYQWWQCCYLWWMMSSFGVDKNHVSSSSLSLLSAVNSLWEVPTLKVCVMSSNYDYCSKTQQHGSASRDQNVQYTRQKPHIWLALILLMWRIGWAPNNASRWQIGFNSAFKGLSPGLCLGQDLDCPSEQTAG